jgi:pimeloyl-ACP methyl ester carboxylesterase
MSKKKKLLIVLAVIAVVTTALQLNYSCVSYKYKAVDLPADFDTFYKMKLAQSKKMNARPGNEEKLLRFADKTPVAILYIHGFNASKGEGEEVVDQIAKKNKYNTYYLRLPGHGTTKEDQASVSYKDLLDEAVTALFMMEKLGDKVVVIGTSMGGMIATYLAAEYPEKIAGTVLASPFYNFPSAMGRMMFFYPAFKLFTAVQPLRVDADPIPVEADNWTLYWYRENFLSATRLLTDLANLIDRKETYRKISGPVLLLYYYKDEAKQDTSASVPDMLRVYDAIQKNGKANPLNKKAAVADGAHVLMSKYVKSDKAPVSAEVEEFLKKIR